MTLVRRIAQLVCLHALLHGAQVMAADPLDKITGFTPTVSFTETEVDKVIGAAGSRSISTSRSTTATIIAAISGITPTAVPTNTAFALNFGDCAISFTLADVLTYSVGQTTAFYCWNGWDALNKPKGTGGVKLTWTATRLTIVVTMSNEATRPAPIASTGFEGAVDPGTGGAVSLKDSVSVEFTFGSITSAQRKVFVTGKSSSPHVYYHNTTAADEEFNVNNISLSGGADYTLPTVALLTPKQGSSVDNSVTLTGKAIDEHGLESVQWSPDPVTAGSWSDVTSNIVSPPADGLWGATSSAWTLDLSGLPHGINKVWVRSIDDSRNESTPLAITVVRPIDSSLSGRWDAALVPVAGPSPLRGALLLTFAANGTCTGTLTLEAATYSLTGSLLPDESFRAVIKPKGLPDIVITGTLSTFTPATAADGALVGNVSISGSSVATFTARRSPWSTKVLADASLAGRFHLITSRPAEPYGYGYLITTTARTGTASISGKLPDGTGVTWSGVMSATGSLPVFVRLYTTSAIKGSLSGSPVIDGPSHAVPSAGMKWVRPANFSDKQFTGGFDLDLTVSGPAYVAAPAAPGNLRVMGLSASSPNATATYAADGVVTPSTQTFTVNANNSITMPSNLDGLTLSVVPSTGLWTGSMKATGTTTRTSIYLLISGPKAWGFYIAEPVTGSTAKRFGSFTVE